MDASENNQEQPLLLIIGCTASGKSSLGMALAQRLGGQIVSADSMMVYRRMDIGTAKPTQADRTLVPHHLLDVVEPSEHFSVSRYVELADAAIADIRCEGSLPMVVGGTALYLKGLTEGLFEGPSADPEFRRTLRQRAAAEGAATLHRELAQVDPEAAQRIHPNDMRRIERALEIHHLTGRPITELQKQWGPQRRYRCQFVALRRQREDLSSRINRRVKDMVADGLVDEVASLLGEPAPLGREARQALGYAQIIDHLQGRRTLDDAIEKIKILTRRFAKNQRTWFRGFAGTIWLDVAPDDTISAIADRAVSAIADRHGDSA